MLDKHACRPSYCIGCLRLFGSYCSNSRDVTSSTESTNALTEGECGASLMHGPTFIILLHWNFT